MTKRENMYSAHLGYGCFEGHFFSFEGINSFISQGLSLGYNKNWVRSNAKKMIFMPGWGLDGFYGGAKNTSQFFPDPFNCIMKPEFAFVKSRDVNFKLFADFPFLFPINSGFIKIDIQHGIVRNSNQEKIHYSCDTKTDSVINWGFYSNLKFSYGFSLKPKQAIPKLDIYFIE